MSQKLECIFLVDDDRSTNFFNSWLLKKLQPECEVKVFKNGKEAIDFLEDADGSGPELILLDVNMPVMNGFDFLRAYREKNTASSAHVVMMLTNALLSDQAAEAKSLGVSHFISKPLTEDKVNQLLEETLGS